MKEKVFKKERQNNAENTKYVSAPFKDIYYSNNNNVIKNYIIEPNKKLID